MIQRWLTMVIAVALVLPAVQVKPQTPNKAYNTQISYGFIENKGQLRDQHGRNNNAVKYMLRNGSMNIQLKQNSFSYDTWRPVSGGVQMKVADPSKINFRKPERTAYHFERVDIQLVGANPLSEIVAEGKSPVYINYSDTQSGQSSRAHFYERVCYRNIYPDIDLVFDSKDPDGKAGFEYYFIVRPGGNPSAIRLRYNGAPSALQGNRIRLQLSTHSIEEKIPASFLSNAKAPDLSTLRQQPGIKVQYKQIDGHTYGFRLPSYDKTKTVVIDPTPDLVWGTYYGGNNNDWGYCITLDPTGNVIVGGASDNANLATAGAYQETFMGFSDAIVGKFTAGGQLLWLTYYGGEYQDVIMAVDTDNNGNIVFGGQTQSKTNIATPGSYQEVATGTNFNQEVFFGKMDGSGNRIWTTYFGGEDEDFMGSLRVDANNDIYLAGYTYSKTGIASPGAYQTGYASGPDPQDWGDAFVARFNGQGKRLWSTYFGGASADGFEGIAVDNAGTVYVSGSTRSAGLATSGALQTTYAGGSADGLLVSFDRDGKRIWATYYGGNNEDAFEAIACDSKGNVLVGGTTSSGNGIATTGAWLSASADGIRDGMIVKFSSMGKRLWGSFYGGSEEEMIYGVTTDAYDNVIVTGFTFSPNNIGTAGAYQPVYEMSGAHWTPFIGKLNPGGTQLLWGTYYGTGGAYGSGIGEEVVTDAAGNVFACGTTMFTSKVATCGAVQTQLGGNQDMYVAMFSETVTPLVVTATIGTNVTWPVCEGSPVSFSAVVINGGTAPAYQWKINGGNAGTNSSGFTTTGLKNGDKVSCTVTSNSPCIADPVAVSNSIPATFTTAVTPAISIVSSAAGAICPGSTVLFTASATNGGSDPFYQWKINDLSVGSNSATFNTSTLSDGDIVSCELTNAQACNVNPTVQSNDIAIEMVSAPVPSIEIVASASRICEEEPVKFSTNIANGGSEPAFQWLLNGQPVSNESVYTTSLLQPSDILECVLTPDIAGCTGGVVYSNQLQIDIRPRPEISISPDSPIISKGDSVALNITGDNFTSYNWSPARHINDAGSASPTVWPDATQTYTVAVTNTDGCRNTKDVLVTVISDIFIPNAFTPNKDGLNETWGIKGLDAYPDCSVKIFNRFGQLVFQSTGYHTPWNGLFNTAVPIQDTYVYVITFKNGKKQLKGTVTILQ